MFTLGLLLASSVVASGQAQATFPGSAWERRDAEKLGLDAAALDRIAEELGGRGCIVKDGYLAKTWGDQAEVGDWYSSAKPVLSTLLFFALQEGRVTSVDQPIADFGWPLQAKDQGITFRHLGAMTSGYARPEGPGEAWAYNDFAIQLYQKTLFEKVFHARAKAVAEAPERLGALGFQDGLTFTQKSRLKASVRDFSRIAWFWLNKGEWDGKQILPRRYFDEYMKPVVPENLPRTRSTDHEEDYLKIASYGGASDQTSAGPGIYGFNWWHNATSRLNPDNLTWPDAPPDTIMSLGHAGNCSAIFPSLRLMVVCANGDWGKEQPGDPASKMNRILGLAAGAAGFRVPVVRITGELRKWHDVTLSFTGPDACEEGTPNPFMDYRLDVTFTRGRKHIVMPGYFAADGNAANTGAEKGKVWRTHFVPDATGTWRYKASFRSGPGVAISSDPNAGTPEAFDGASGTLRIQPSDKLAPDFRARGLLRYAGKRYLQFAETGEYFLKGGADSPENFLAFADFDQTPPTHHFEPHAGDWRPGDPLWGDAKGKGIIGALNYLSGKEMNSVYFLTMNVNGDGKDVWPWISDSERVRFDCSKLDQWGIVFSHMDRLGLLLHVVLQEQENDHLLDGGELGPERRLYYRELAARFAHHLALVWNLGEENRNSEAQQRAFAECLHALDPYNHPRVVHTFPKQREKVYAPLLGCGCLEGPSLQLSDMKETHGETLQWTARSRGANRPWFVCLDEIGPPDIGVKADTEDPGHDNVRRHALWGNLMAGGAGCEWFFQSDNHCEDWRSRDGMWDLTRHALSFFRLVPFAEMQAHDELVRGEGAWCLAKPGKVYVVYAPRPAGVTIDLPRGRFRVQWYNPRVGGALIKGMEVRGAAWRTLSKPPQVDDQDWVILLQKRPRFSR